MSWALRHAAAELGLAPDEAGWVSLDRLAAALEVDPGEIVEVVKTNVKQRFRLDGGRIRAVQGHSGGVDPAALESSWTPYVGSGPLVHGTRLEVLATIAREGLRPMGRTHVHLAPSADSVVGIRAGVDVMLEIDPAACGPLFCSENGVILARAVPPSAIVGVLLVSRKAREAEAEVRGLGLTPRPPAR